MNQNKQAIISYAMIAVALLILLALVVRMGTLISVIKDSGPTINVHIENAVISTPVGDPVEEDLQMEENKAKSATKKNVKRKQQKPATANSIKVKSTRDFSEKDRLCLYQNVLEEAASEPYKGKLAVAKITLNRVDTGRWGDNICDVVHSYKQFSWTLKKNRMAKKGKAWDDSVQASEQMLKEHASSLKTLNKSLNYHANYVSPDWARELTQVAVIGKHIFYQN